MTEADRFWAKVDRSAPPPDDPWCEVAGNCWVWTAGKIPAGYGAFRVSSPRKIVMAHRWAYEYGKGPIPPGKDLVVDHLCRNKLCVNPDHLEVVTRFENISRGWDMMDDPRSRFHRSAAEVV